MADYISEIASFLIGGIAGSFLTLTIKSIGARGKANSVDQSESKAGGDLVGRDKITK